MGGPLDGAREARGAEVRRRGVAYALPVMHGQHGTDIDAHPGGLNDASYNAELFGAFFDPPERHVIESGGESGLKARANSVCHPTS